MGLGSGWKFVHPAKTPTPDWGTPGILGIGWCMPCQCMPCQCMPQIRSAYSESLMFNPPTCLGSPVSLCHHLILAPLVIPIFHPYRQQIKTFPQAIKGMLLIRHQFSWLKTCRSPTLHRPTSKLKNTVIPHRIHLTLPPDDHSSVWTSQEFWKNVGYIWDRLVFFCMFSIWF